MCVVRGPFEKFVDTPYHSESELCGGAVTVPFFEVTPLASDALLTTLHPLLRNVLQTVCRKLQEDSGTGSFLTSELPLHGWKKKKTNRMGRDLDSIGLMDEL
jgi:hypothetical protein